MASRETRQLPDDAIFRVWARSAAPRRHGPEHQAGRPGAQLAAFSKLGRPLDYLLNDLVALQGHVNARHRFGLSARLSYGAFATSPASMLRLCTAARTYLSLPGPMARKEKEGRKRRDLDLREDDRYTFERVVLVLVLGIGTPEHLQAWVDLVELLPPEQRGVSSGPRSMCSHSPPPGTS